MGRRKRQRRPGKIPALFSVFLTPCENDVFCAKIVLFGKGGAGQIIRTKITHVATVCAEILSEEKQLHCCIWSGLLFAQTESVLWLMLDSILNVSSKEFRTLERR